MADAQPAPPPDPDRLEVLPDPQRKFRPLLSVHHPVATPVRAWAVLKSGLNQSMDMDSITIATTAVKRAKVFKWLSWRIRFITHLPKEKVERSASLFSETVHAKRKHVSGACFQAKAYSARLSANNFPGLVRSPAWQLPFCVTTGTIEIACLKIQLLCWRRPRS